MKLLRSQIIFSLLVHLVFILACVVTFRSLQEWGDTSTSVEQINWIELSGTSVIPAQAGIQSVNKRKLSLDAHSQPANVAGKTGSSNDNLEVGNNSSGNELLRQIRQRISQAKQYPMMAKEQGVEGVVTLLFSIGSHGTLADAQILKTSGSPLLDQAALETLKRAMPYPEYQQPIQLSLKYDLSE